MITVQENGRLLDQALLLERLVKIGFFDVLEFVLVPIWRSGVHINTEIFYFHNLFLAVGRHCLIGFLVHTNFLFSLF